MTNKKQINIEIGLRIKKYREELNMTQERLSEALGIAPKTVSAMERGVIGISLTTLTKLCVVLSISADKLLFENSNENNIDSLTSKIKYLPENKFIIVNAVVNKLLEVLK